MENSYLKKAKRYFDEVGIYVDFSECKEAMSLNNAEIGDCIEEKYKGEIISAKIVAIFTNIKRGDDCFDLAIGIDEDNNDCYFLVSDEAEEMPSYDFGLN